MAAPPQGWESGIALRPVFESAVSRRLAIPADDAAAYGERLDAAFARASVQLARAQYVPVVDRSPQVQALLIYGRDDAGRWHPIGAAPVSTGSRGGFEHVITPLGVFAHSTAEPVDAACATEQCRSGRLTTRSRDVVQRARLRKPRVFRVS
jgi:hypothetical protein